MKSSYKAALFWSILIECAVVLFAVTIGVRQDQSVNIPADCRPLILLDAGHGGEDGGAVAPDGTTEKDINLDITLTLQDMLRFCGYRVAVTRETDTGLGTGDSLRARKSSDMNARLALYNNADLVIAIHQNKFGDTACHGAQFFYSKNAPASETLAQSLKSSLTRLLQPNNTRELKTGDRNVFLLYKTTTPAVLAECGFLSNPDEFLLLNDADYRKDVAFSLCCGVLDYAP